MDNTRKNLSGKSFKAQNLVNADFSGTDLRSTDFTGAVLTNANFSNSRTGLKTSSAVLVFIISLAVSLLSGYFAMLSGATIQLMIKSTESNIVTAGYITTGLMLLLFSLFTIGKVGANIITYVAITIILVLLTGLIFKLSGLGTGMGSIYASIALVLFVVMIAVGTISRAVAGTLSSSIIFFVVAIGGSIFGKSVGGGIGTVILAISCAAISKRILAGKGNFPVMKKIAMTTGTYFGTSFKNADLTDANFSSSNINNTDFTGAKLSGVKWENSTRKFSLIEE